MKRSKQINIENMRKESVARPLLKPLTWAVASITLAACSGGSEEEVQVVSSVEDCTASTSLTLAQCEVAYQQALEESARTAPRYTSQAACEAEFGYDQCNRTNQGFFMPFMAGYMVSSLLNRGGGYSNNPVYHYRNRGSSYNDRIMTSDGSVIGRAGQRSYKVSSSDLKPKPSPTRTVSRGGFGSTASAKSSWGGGKSKSWGG